jgi:hypothetical protein
MEPLNVQQELTLLTETLTSLQIEAAKFDEGNGAAGRRLRLHLANLRNNMQALRFLIQEQKNQRRAIKKAQSQQ